MIHNNISVEDVAYGLSNFTYAENFQATKELMELFDNIKKSKVLGTYESKKPLDKAEDYIKFYDENFYTYGSWTDLVESEEEQGDGLTEEECRKCLNKTIWQLPCGWYVQYV